MAATDEDVAVKKPTKEKEILVVQDQDEFVHCTGDVYDGGFEVKKKDKVAKMQGPGLYTTTEGDSYQGVWENDKLGANEDVTVTFSDGSRYQGSFKDWGYTGKGTYCYPDGSTLKSVFDDNCPVGKLVFTDPNGHTWLGKAEQGFCWYTPVNHYYDMLDQTLEVPKGKRRQSKRPDAE